MDSVNRIDDNVILILLAVCVGKSKEDWARPALKPLNARENSLSTLSHHKGP